MKLAPLFVIAAAACGKSAAAPPPVPEIKTAPRTLILDGGGYYQVSGPMPDWKVGDRRDGRGEDQLYVEAYGELVGSFRVRPWYGYLSDGSPKDAFTRAADSFLKSREHDDGSSSVRADKQVEVQGVTAVGDHAWSHAVGWSSTGDDGVAVRVGVAQPDNHDPAHPMHGFTCELVVHRRNAGSKSEVDYRETWKSLAEICSHLTMAPVKR